LGAILSPTTYKFDEFELDGARFELRRGGRVQRLERIPLELLILLAERNGEVVSRQQIIERLWGKDVFVDTEHGINTAIRKVRAALRDDAEKSRYIQTVSGKGYRFIGRSNGNDNADAVVPEKSIVTRVPTVVEKPKEVSRATNSAWKPAGLVLAIAVLVVAGLFAFNASGVRERVFSGNQIGPIHSIAVLPLANLSGDRSQDYFADGMTDEMITALAENHSLRVVSRTSVMQYKGVNKPLREIASALGVDGILEGSVIRSNGQVHVNLQLIYAPTDTHVWAQSYDRNLNDAIALPEEVSQIIAAKANTPAPAVKTQRYVSPEAHDAYMQGLYFWYGFNPDRSLEYFEKAVQFQPDYAAAWSGVANSYAAKAVLNRSPAKDVTSKVEDAARKAVALDDSSPEAHNALAMWYLLFAWNLGQADAESRRSLELNPNFAESHEVRAYVLEAMNHPDESFRETAAAVALDPLKYVSELGEAYMARRQFAEAIAELRRRDEAAFSNFFIHFDLAQLYWLKGMKKESVEEWEKAYRDDAAKTSALGRAYATGGPQAAAQWLLDDLKAGSKRSGYLPPFEMARRYAFLGDKANTLKFLELSYQEHYPWTVMVQGQPMFDFVHAEPRYQALIKKMGLAPAY
jgi:TolB-like protein/DNA-binding winged helix-turn-helix (wHTH) protein